MKKQIGKAIKIMRIKEDLKQIDLADKSGIDQAVISNMENAKGLTLDNLFAVCEVFQIPLSDLFILAEDMV